MKANPVHHLTITAVVRTPATSITPERCLYALGTRPDLYYCLTHENGCPDNDAYEDIWSRAQGKTLPEDCNQSGNNCEAEATYRAVYGARRNPPGHEHFPSTDKDHHHPVFADSGAVCDWLKSHYPNPPGPPSSWECRYYKLPSSVSGLGEDFYFVMAPANAPHSALPHAGVRYFGLETQEFTSERHIELHSAVAKLNRNGTVLSIKYDDGSGERIGLVWLR